LFLEGRLKVFFVMIENRPGPPSRGQIRNYPYT
jgi:hypothetical protein